MINAFKLSWRYLKNYKKLLSITIISLIFVQALAVFSPLLIRTIIDEHLLGIQKPFYLVNEEDKKTINIDGKYYKQERYFNNENKKSEQLVQVIYIEDQFYISDKLIVSGSKKIIGNKLIVSGNTSVTYEISKISSSTLKEFYSPSRNMLIILVALLLIRPLFAACIGFIQKISSAYIIVDLTKEGRIDAARKLHKIPISFFEDEPVGKTANRITNDVSGITMTYERILNLGFNATISFILAMSALFYLDKTLALITLAVVPFLILWASFFMKIINKIAVAVNEFASLITGSLNENINNVSIIKLFNYQEGSLNKFNDLSQKHINSSIKEVKLHGTVGWNMISLIRGLATALVVIYFGRKQLLGATIISAGTIYAYNDLIQRIIDPIKMLYRELGNIEHGIVRTNRFFMLVDAKSEDFSYESRPKTAGKIEFKNIWYAYNDTNFVLKGLNLSIPANYTVGIVGHTGSGKSTLMSLLMRFYDMKETDVGEILIDDLNINSISKRTYRQHIGIILQDPILFRGTIASNIRYGNENISDDEIIQMLIKIGGEGILNAYSLGINQKIVRRGENLSIGERQLISFARVLASDPAILIMDEATANIDTETEKLVQNALNIISKNRTVIIIAHRLSTIRNSDKIVVLEKGVLVEEGTHEQLMKVNGYYKNLYRGQVE